MAFLGGKGREELLIELAETKGENKALRSQVEFLQEQLRKTQDALIAKEAQEAYQDQKAAEESARPVPLEVSERREKMKKQMELEKNWLENMEAPLFKDADDMQAMLLPILNKPAESRSVHDNGES